MRSYLYCWHGVCWNVDTTASNHSKMIQRGVASIIKQLTTSESAVVQRTALNAFANLSDDRTGNINHSFFFFEFLLFSTFSWFFHLNFLFFCFLKQKTVSFSLSHTHSLSSVLFFNDHLLNLDMQPKMHSD